MEETNTQEQSSDLVEELEVDISSLEVKDGDVLILKFSQDMYNEDLQMFMDTLRESFPDNKIIAISNDMDILCKHPNESVDLLERMIAHIKIESNRPSIIL